MDAAGKALLWGTLLAVILGAGVLLARNGNSPAGMFENSYAQCAKTNKRYYPHIPAVMPAEERDANEE